MNLHNQNLFVPIELCSSICDDDATTNHSKAEIKKS